MHAYETIAAREGVFAEPASAASIAGVYEAEAAKANSKAARTVVCVLTGHGLKDPNIAIKSVNAEPIVVQDTEAAVMEAIRKLEEAANDESPGNREGSGQHGVNLGPALTRLAWRLSLYAWIEMAHCRKDGRYSQSTAWRWMNGIPR